MLAPYSRTETKSFSRRPALMARISCAIYALSQTIHSLKSTANTKDMILPRRIRDKERPVTFSKQRRNSNLRVCIASCEAHYEAGKVGQHCKIKGKSQPTWKLAKRLASPCGSRCYRLLRGLAPEVPPGADTKSRIYINNSAPVLSETALLMLLYSYNLATYRG